MDNIDHPKHYTQGKIETIDIIEAVIETKQNVVHAYLISNIVKYLCRYEYKNGLEDLKKARWYLDRLINKIENQSQK